MAVVRYRQTIPFFLQVGIISVQGSTQRPLATALAFRSSGLTTTELLRLVVAQSLRLYGYRLRAIAVTLTLIK